MQRVGLIYYLRLVQLPEDVGLAFTTWTDAVTKAEGKNYFINQQDNASDYNKLFCTPKHDSIARSAFKNVTISAITVGHNISKAQCQ
jgi:hypothetical protein